MEPRLLKGLIGREGPKCFQTRLFPRQKAHFIVETDVEGLKLMNQDLYCSTFCRASSRRLGEAPFRGSGRGGELFSPCFPNILLHISSPTVPGESYFLLSNMISCFKISHFVAPYEVEPVSFSSLMKTTRGGNPNLCPEFLSKNYGARAVLALERVHYLHWLTYVAQAPFLSKGLFQC